jgi:YihY family inner membrane protein
MKINFQKIIDKFDRFQRKHKIIGFLYALQTKYSQDNGGQQAALLTYYGFLSLFPLLLAATSILQIILSSRPDLRASVINHATTYFPVLGEQLQSNVTHVSGAGIGLAVGIILAIWGAKGVADVFQDTMNRLWGIPMNKRPGFPHGHLKSLGMMTVGGLGFVTVSVIASLTFSLDRTFFFWLMSIAVSIILLFGLFWLLIKWALADSSLVTTHSLRTTAISAAVSVQVLQLAGGYLITHELGNFKHLYGTFAATLVLLFWIYLQARVVVYCAEAGMVSARQLYPRAINRQHLTDKDKRAFAAYAEQQKFVEPEQINVKFKDKD